MQSTPEAARRQAVSPEERQGQVRILHNLIESIAPARAKRAIVTPGDRVRLLDHLAVHIYNRSGGQICIYGPHYIDRWHRMWVQHTTCGNWFWASITELTAAGDAGACPHCYPCSDLARFGSLENLRAFIHARSHCAVEIFSNRLGSTRRRYHFYCRYHRRLYLARFTEFLQAAGMTNGCPDCATDLSRANSGE